MESVRTRRPEEEEDDDEDDDVSQRDGEDDSEAAKDDKILKVGPGKLAELATVLDGLVNKIASGMQSSFNPLCRFFFSGLDRPPAPPFLSVIPPNFFILKFGVNCRLIFVDVSGMLCVILSRPLAPFSTLLHI